jgi:hypothetical protein
MVRIRVATNTGGLSCPLRRKVRPLGEIDLELFDMAMRYLLKKKFLVVMSARPDEPVSNRARHESLK